MPKTFVVDACLAMDAGSKEPPADRGLRVRIFLLALRDSGHQVGFTAELETEWKNHAARFARRWLVELRSRRRVLRLSTALNVQLRNRALATAENENVYDAMEKDWHLLEAALSTDRTIASSDDNARFHYVNAAIQVGDLKAVVWVNPATSDLKTWVENDAPSDAEKRLG